MTSYEVLHKFHCTYLIYNIFVRAVETLWQLINNFSARIESFRYYRYESWKLFVNSTHRSSYIFRGSTAKNTTGCRIMYVFFFFLKKQPRRYSTFFFFQTSNPPETVVATPLDYPRDLQCDIGLFFSLIIPFFQYSRSYTKFSSEINHSSRFRNISPQSRCRCKQYTIQYN